MKICLRLLVVLACIGSATQAEAGLILAFDSLTPAAGGSITDLSRIDTETDSAFVASSSQFSSSSSNVAGAFVHGTQSATVTLGDQNDLQFRFGDGTGQTIFNNAVLRSSQSGNLQGNDNYLDFSFTAAQAQILDEFSFDLFVNNAGGSSYAARDSGLFIDVNGGGFNQFGVTNNQGGNGDRGTITFTDAVTVGAGDTITYRLALADKQNTNDNLQAATRIGSVLIGAEAIAVPEPSSAIALLGVAGIGFLRRRK